MIFISGSLVLPVTISDRLHQTVYTEEGSLLSLSMTNLEYRSTNKTDKIPGCPSNPVIGLTQFYI